MTLNAHIVGDKRIRNILTVLSVTARQCAIDCVNESALNIQRKAREASPVKTGRLRASIRPVYATKANLAASVSTDVHYASHVEFGTIRTKAQPFLLPAWDQERPKLVKCLKKCLGPRGRAIRRARSQAGR